MEVAEVLLIEAVSASVTSEAAAVAALQRRGTRLTVAVAVDVLHWKVIVIALKLHMLRFRLQTFGNVGNQTSCPIVESYQVAHKGLDFWGLVGLFIIVNHQRIEALQSLTIRRLDGSGIVDDLCADGGGGVGGDLLLALAASAASRLSFVVVVAEAAAAAAKLWRSAGFILCMALM